MPHGDGEFLVGEEDRPALRAPADYRGPFVVTGAPRVSRRGHFGDQRRLNCLYSQRDLRLNHRHCHRLRHGPVVQRDRLPRLRLSTIMGSQSFHPALSGGLPNPFLLARRRLANAIREDTQDFHKRLRDVGYGSKLYVRFFNVEQYVGLDIDTPRTRSLEIADHLVVGATIMPRLSQIGIALGRILPPDGDLFLDQIVFVRKSSR